MGFRLLHIFLFSCVLMLFENELKAQCPGGGAPLTVTTNNGIDGQYVFTSAANFSFDKFDSSLGTLLSANIRINISGLIESNVQNNEASTESYDVTIGRRDRFTAPSLGINLLQTDSTVDYATTIAGHNNSSEFIFAPIGRTISATVTDPTYLANYYGNDFGNIEYRLLTSSSIWGYGSYVGTITTHYTHVLLTVTYTYCPHAILSNNGKLSFTAQNKNNNNVLLTWTKEQEISNVLYTPEISLNGRDFSAIATLQSEVPDQPETVVLYEQSYQVPNLSNDKIYFRVKQVAPDGTVAYSDIKIIYLQSEVDKFSIYPNPVVNAFTLSFDSPQKHTLNVSLINSVGQTVEARNINLNGSNIYQYGLNAQHPPGAYFLKVVNATSGKQQVLRLLIK